MGEGEGVEEGAVGVEEEGVDAEGGRGNQKRV